MKTSTTLDHIDNGHMALPELQSGYVWNRDQVREFYRSARSNKADRSKEEEGAR